MTPTVVAPDLYRLATMAAPTGIFLIDTAGEATFVNPRLCEILGAPADEILGAGFVGCIHPEDRARATRHIAEKLTIGEGTSTDYRLVRSGTTEVWVRVWASPIRDGAGAITGIAGVLEDITRVRAEEEQSRALEAKLQRTHKLESLGVLAGGIAHDFNNLLVGIVGNAALVQMDVDPASEAGAALEDLRLAAERATELTAQLLAFSGRGASATMPVDLTAAVEETHTLLKSTIPPRVHVTLALAAALPLVTGDATRLRQLVMNLLTNAADAIGEEGGEITIRTGSEMVDEARKSALMVDGGVVPGRQVLLEVRDTGCGMSAATLGRIFDPFFTTKAKGRGLGLAATIGTIRAHKAGLEVTSEPGVGTTFRLLLPIDPTQPVTVPVERRSSARLAGAGTILVVDDDAAVRDVTRRLLTRQGFDVLEAADGPTGVKLLIQARDRIRLVLLDMSMPGMDGCETCREMRTAVPTARVVLTSGHSEASLNGRVQGSGIVGFLQKPFDLSTLLRVTKAALDG
ncbi:MAG: response regulator [Gemmatimonadetes bacterium]|nr:response regulator [Gemmatimonadota bacterium]